MEYSLKKTHYHHFDEILLDQKLSNLSDTELNIFLHALKKEKKKRTTRRTQKIDVPLCVFTQDLAPAQSLVKFLKENKKLSYRDISQLIGRDERGIWTLYKHACEKKSGKILITSHHITVPIQVFSQRPLSILESLVNYLHQKQNYTLQSISKLLKKSYPSIYTVNQRALKKIGGAKQ